MENAKSVIDIEVNDDEFKRFHDLFMQYKEQLDKTPNSWEKADAATGNSVSAMRELVAAMQAQRTLIKEQTEERKKLAEEEKKQADLRKSQQKKEEDALKRQNKLLEERHKGIKSMGATMSSILGTTMGIGLNIAKWGAGIGIGLIGGGVFGLERLASTATAERTQSRGLGVSPGELRAWRTNFGNYGDPESLLTAASNAPTDANSRAMFMRAGVGADVIRSGNTSQIAEQALQGMASFFNRNQGPNAQAVWSAYGFDRVMGYNQMRQFAGASQEERSRMFGSLHNDIRSMGTGDPTMRAWQDFYTQLQRSGQELKTTFLDGLVKLSGPIGELSGNLTELVRTVMGSDGFKEVITDISHGLHDLSDSMKDGSFKKGIDDFTTALHKFSQSGELRSDLQTLQEAIHIAAESVGWLVNIISKSPRFGGSGWGDQKMQSDGNGKWHWVDNPDNKGFGFSDLWSWLSNNIGPSAAHADTLGASRQYGMNRYLDAIAQTESRGDPNAVSKAGAQGLFQLMPSVQKQYGVTNPFDPEQSRRGASALIADLYSQFNGDMLKATAAYNAGGGRVSSAVSKYGDDWLSHMPNETQQYVGRVARNFQSSGISIQIHNNTGGAATVTAAQARAL